MPSAVGVVPATLTAAAATKHSLVVTMRPGSRVPACSGVALHNTTGYATPTRLATVHTISLPPCCSPPPKCFRGKPLGGFHTFCEPALGVSPLQWSTVHWQLRRRLLRQMTRSRMARTLTMLRKCTGTGGMIPSRSMPHGRSISRVWSKGCLVPRHSNLPRLWLLHPQTVRRPSTQLEAQSWTITSK